MPNQTTSTEDTSLYWSTVAWSASALTGVTTAIFTMGFYGNAAALQVERGYEDTHREIAKVAAGIISVALSTGSLVLGTTVMRLTFHLAKKAKPRVAGWTQNLRFFNLSQPADPERQPIIESTTSTAPQQSTSTTFSSNPSFSG